MSKSILNDIIFCVMVPRFDALRTLSFVSFSIVLLLVFKVGESSPRPPFAIIQIMLFRSGILF